MLTLQATNSYLYFAPHNRLPAVKMGLANHPFRRLREIELSIFDIKRAVVVAFPMRTQAHAVESRLAREFVSHHIPPDCLGRINLGNSGHTEWYSPCILRNLHETLSGLPLEFPFQKFDDYAQSLHEKVSDGRQLRGWGDKPLARDCDAAGGLMECLDEIGELSYETQVFYSESLRRITLYAKTLSTAVAHARFEELFARISAWQICRVTKRKIFDRHPLVKDSAAYVQFRFPPVAGCSQQPDDLYEEAMYSEPIRFLRARFGLRKRNNISVSRALGLAS